MQVITVTGGRENKDFYKKLEAYDDKDYDLVNIVATHSGRFIAFLRCKNPKKAPNKDLEALKKPKI